MEFEVSDRMKTILNMIEEFMLKEIVPMEPEFLTKEFKEMLPALEEKRKMVKKMELWAPNHPKEYGGMGLGLMEHALVSEALGYSPLGHFIFGCQAPDAGNVELLYHYGTEEQKAKYLKPLIDGKIRSSFAMTEPEVAGSNPTMIQATAVKEGDDYVINGHKWFASSTEGARFSIAMVVTDTGPDANPYLKASMIIVPTDMPGFNLVRNIPVMGHKGSDYASHGEILFQNCRVPKTNLLGPEGHGFIMAQERLGPGRIHHCMRWLGVCKRSMELMINFALERDIAPGNKKLATRQIIQMWAAECEADVLAARLMTLHAAWKAEKLGQKEARYDISFLKFFVANVMQKVVDRAMQVHGGLGVSDYSILSFFYRQERAARVYDGTDEIHKFAASRRVFEKYKGRKSPW